MFFTQKRHMRPFSFSLRFNPNKVNNIQNIIQQMSRIYMRTIFANNFEGNYEVVLEKGTSVQLYHLHQKPPKVSHIPTLFYRLETEDEEFNITDVQGKVSFKLLVTKKTMVRVLACSNSGCSNPYSQGTCKLGMYNLVSYID